MWHKPGEATRVWHVGPRSNLCGLPLHTYSTGALSQQSLPKSRHSFWQLSPRGVAAGPGWLLGQAQGMRGRLALGPSSERSHTECILLGFLHSYE